MTDNKVRRVLSDNARMTNHKTTRQGGTCNALQPESRARRKRAQVNVAYYWHFIGFWSPACRN